MAHITAIALQKGGTGKSTTAHALGQGLLKAGKKVLFIDLDPQGNLSTTMQATEGKYSAYDVITNRVSVKKAVQHTGYGDIIPASPQLSGTDLEVTQTGKEYRIREALAQLGQLYDFMVIDTPPALGTLTINALTAASGVIIPVQAETYSIQGITQLFGTIDVVKNYCNPGLLVEGILLTRFSNRAILSRDMADVIGETALKFGTKLYRTAIREGIAVKEAQAVKMPLLRYAPESNPAKDYDQFVAEYLENH
ncbi:MAG: ParA family protein [Chlorobiaceae bacterium]|nr:ParA family protein [Chlorobiaceae bacterium]NTV61451.1 ParA family protein [Chlorobiaceae bacterium]